MTSNPTGTVTFLFTDIEGSTKLARENSETWEVLRSRHDRILRDAIESNNGYVSKLSVMHSVLRSIPQAKL